MVRVRRRGERRPEDLGEDVGKKKFAGSESESATESEGSESEDEGTDSGSGSETDSGSESGSGDEGEDALEGVKETAEDAQPNEAVEGAGGDAEALADAEIEEPVSADDARASDRDSESVSDDERESVKSGEEDNAAAEPVEVEVKEEEIKHPSDVPKAGKFFMHDDRRAGGSKGRGRGREKKLWEAEESKWEHDMFHTLEQDNLPERFNDYGHFKKGGRGRGRGRGGPRRESVGQTYADTTVSTFTDGAEGRSASARRGNARPKDRRRRADGDTQGAGEHPQPHGEWPVHGEGEQQDGPGPAANGYPSGNEQRPARGRGNNANGPARQAGRGRGKPREDRHDSRQAYGAGEWQMSQEVPTEPTGWGEAADELIGGWGTPDATTPAKQTKTERTGRGSTKQKEANSTSWGSPGPESTGWGEPAEELIGGWGTPEATIPVKQTKTERTSRGSTKQKETNSTSWGSPGPEPTGWGSPPAQEAEESFWGDDNSSQNKAKSAPLIARTNQHEPASENTGTGWQPKRYSTARGQPMPQQQQPQPQQFVPQQRPLFATPPAQTTPPRAASKPLLPQNPMQYAAMPPQHGGPRPLMMPDMGMMMGNNRSPHKGMGTSSRHALQQQQMAYESDMSNSMANVSLQTHASQQEQGGQAPAATSRPFVLPKEFVPQQFRAPAQLQHQQAQRNTSAPPKLQAPAEQYSPMPNEYMAQLEASQAQLHAMLAYGVITPETFTAASQQLVLAFTDPSSAMAYEQQQQSQMMFNPYMRSTPGYDMLPPPMVFDPVSGQYVPFQSPMTNQYMAQAISGSPAGFMGAPQMQPPQGGGLMSYPMQPRQMGAGQQQGPRGPHSP